MFGILIVCLSSPHTGGDLVLQHGAEKLKVKKSTNSEFGASYAAWYSDVLHEVKPFTSGYRLVLTYNLIKNDTAPISLARSFGSRVLYKIEEAAIQAPKAAYWYTLIPFVKSIISTDAPIFDSVSRTRLQRLITTILTRTLHVCVGPEPITPRDWTKHTTFGCSSHRCTDCALVNAFLRSPTERVGQFPCSKPRHFHLHKNFNDDNISKKDWTVETIRDRNPNVWTITKNHGDFEGKRKAWKEDFEMTSEKMQELVACGGGGGGTLLREYLGELYDAITSSRVERLEQLSSPVPPTTITALAPTPSQSKRPLSGAVSHAGSSTTKRARTAVADNVVVHVNDEAQVIDLTEE